MSSRFSGLTWETDLPPIEKFILLAMADHADHEGENVRPSVALICHKTGYSRSTVLKAQARLRDLGILEVVEMRQAEGRPTLYNIDADSMPMLPPWRPKKPGKPGPVTPSVIRTTPVRITDHPRPGDGPQNQLQETTTEKEQTPPTPAGAGGVVAHEVPVGGAGKAKRQPPTRNEVKEREAAAVDEVLADYNEVTGRRRNYKPSSEGWRCVLARIREGYTREQLRLAIMGAWASPWHRGQNDKGPNGTGKDYTFPENILRSADKVEAHIRTARAALTPEPWWPVDEDAPAAPPAPAAKQSGASIPSGPIVFTQRDMQMRALAEALHAKDSVRVEALKAEMGIVGDVSLPEAA